MTVKRMEIYLLRHGIAEEGRLGGHDADRALTAEGRDKLKRVLKRAHDAGVRPGLILASPYRRAWETAEIAAEALQYRGEIVKTSNLVPNTSPQEAWGEIGSRWKIAQADTKGAMLLASHEPLMSYMTAFLLSAPTLQVDMKKGAMVRVDCDHFEPEPHGVLKWMLTAGLA
jgi:phosphohistidine phosphatase